MNTFRIIHKLNNSVIISKYRCNKLSNHSKTISNKTYQIPLLNDIYNYLIKKLNKDIVNIIIMNYFNELYNVDKYNISKYLRFYLSANLNYCEEKKKYILSCINTNTNSVGKTYNKYNFKLLLNFQDCFYKDINNILSNINK